MPKKAELCCWLVAALCETPKGGGEDGIRTHVTFPSNGFQDRLVMTASIPLRVSQFASCDFVIIPYPERNVNTLLKISFKMFTECFYSYQTFSGSGHLHHDLLGGFCACLNKAPETRINSGVSGALPLFPFDRCGRLGSKIKEYAVDVFNLCAYPCGYML